MELRLLPEATAAARRAVAELSAAGVPLMAAEAQLRVAQLALLAGDHARRSPPPPRPRPLSGGKHARAGAPGP